MVFVLSGCTALAVMGKKAVNFSIRKSQPVIFKRGVGILKIVVFSLCGQDNPIQGVHERRKTPTLSKQVGKNNPVKKNVKRGGIRRGGRKKCRKNINETMVFIGSNSAGLANKVDSFRRLISLFSPGVIFIQESKLKRKGMIKEDNFVIFEQLRKTSGGGGC